MNAQTVHEIFRRMNIRYGRKFVDAYPSTSLEDLARDWAEVLDGTSDHAINYAMVNLPIDWPPTAGQFLSLCRSAPSPADRQARLPPPKDTPENRAARESALSKLRAFQFGQGDPRAWITALIEKRNAGEKLSAGQRHCLKEALLNLGLDANGHGNTAVGDTNAGAADQARTNAMKAASDAKVAAYLQKHPGAM